MAASNPPVINTAFITYVALQDMANPGSYKANPTLAAGDVQYSLDGAAFQNLGTLPAVTPASGVAVKVTMASGEMNGDNIFIKFIDQTNPKEWADYAFNVQTVAAGWNVGKTGYALSVAGVQAIWDALTSALTTVGSIGKLLADDINATISSRSSHTAADVWAVATRILTAATNITSTGGTTVPQTGDSFARIGVAGAGLTNIDLPNQTFDLVGNITGNLSGSVGSVTGAVGSVTADVGITQTGADKVWASAARTLTSFGTLVADIWASATRTLTSFGTLTADAADKLLGRNLAGGSDGGRTVKDALRLLRNKRSIAAGTLTVTQEDDATPAWTAAVGTTASDPTSSIDPA